MNEGDFKSFSQFGESFRFYIDNPNDLIQSRHAKGRLYEAEELEIILRHFPKGGVCYDIGANVGNHAIFLAKVMGCHPVYVFEANPAAARVLKKNIDANGLEYVINTSFLGIGVGLSSPVKLEVHNPQANNLGAARLKGGGQGTIEIKSIDDLNIQEDPNFVKIDVEGMEIDVLNGMRQVIDRSRPFIFAEINNTNVQRFYDWASENNYVILEDYTRYKSSVNFMIGPA